jgi:hypothetical protein
MLVYGCVCSGIGAATVAWEPLGWRPAWFSEILPFPGAVLKHRYPNVPNLGDMTRLPGNRAFMDSKIDNSMFDCHPFHNTSNGVTIPRRSPLGPTTRTGRPLERSSIVATESSSAHTGASTSVMSPVSTASLSGRANRIILSLGEFVARRYDASEKSESSFQLGGMVTSAATGRKENEFINMLVRTELSGCQRNAQTGSLTIKSRAPDASPIGASSRIIVSSTAWLVRWRAKAPS